MTVPKKSKTKTFYFKNVFQWQHSVLISTGDQQIDVSSYLTPKSPNNDFTWEETDTDYVFKLQLFWKPGWGSFFLQKPAAAEDPQGHIWFFDFNQYPHKTQYEPPKYQEDSLLTWREVLSLTEATQLATELAGGRLLSPTPPLILNSFCFPGDSGCVLPEFPVILSSESFI